MTANYKVDRKQLAVQGQQWLTTQVRSVDAVARDDLDRSLIAVWEEVLGIDGIGLDDHVFALGGHSLLALKLVNEMRRVSGLELPSTVLFEHPTIRAVRDHAGEASCQTASVVKLNQVGGDHPVFCLCGVQVYRPFADQFANKRPVYGVFAQMEVAFISDELHQETRDYSISKLVDTYVDAIKRQGNFQQVSLVGLSFGGLIALEVAKKLKSEGVHITSVTLLDSYMTRSCERSLSALGRDLSTVFRRQGLRGLAKTILSGLRQRIPVASARAEKRAWEMNLAETARSKAFDRAAKAYDKIDKQYDFNVLLIKASETDFGLGIRGKHDYGLSAFVQGELAIKTILADHLGLMVDAPVIAAHRLMVEHEASLL